MGTVFKVAKNKLGLNQNREEVAAFMHPAVKASDIVIPVIDWDKESFRPTWINCEKADPIPSGYFENKYGMRLPAILAFAADGKTGMNDLVDKLGKLLRDAPNIDPSDLFGAGNWGIYKGNPVIIDLGISHTPTYDISVLDKSS